MPRLKNAKAKGSRSEFKTIKLLEALGYRCMKSGGSLGCWDVVGVGTAAGLGGILVQVKSNGWPGTVEMETLRNFSCDPMFKREVHRWDDYARIPRIRVL